MRTVTMRVLLAVLVVATLAAARSTSAPSSPPDDQPEDIGSPLTVAQCRAQCLQRFTSLPSERPSQCLQSPDCYMCWENCQLLQSNYPVWGAMCNEKSLCFPGCQQACSFHRRSRPHRQQQAVVLTGGLAAIRVQGGPGGSGSPARASWPAPPARSPGPAGPAGTPGSRPLVYVLMRRTTQPAWTQITQTVDLSSRLPEDFVVDRHSFRVLVVGPEGLQTIYSPAPDAAPTPAPSASSTVAPASPASVASPARPAPPSASPAPGSASSQQRRINTAIKPALPGQHPPPAAPAPAPAPKEQGWHLHEDSLIHQKVLVIAELSWAKRGATGGVYLVTWEVDGGGLKGNLFTDSTHVTLSLWPDTVYHVQVELVSDTRPSGPGQSASLVVDTRRAVPSTLGSRGPTASSRIPLSIAASPSSSSSSPSSASSALPDLHRGPFLMLAPLPSKRHVPAAAEKHLADPLRRQAAASSTLLAATAALVLVSLAVGAVLVWRCRGSFFRRGAGAVGDSSPFIGALAAEEGELPPHAAKKAGILSAAFSAPPPVTEVLAPVVTLVSEGDVVRSSSSAPSASAVASPCAAKDGCHRCPRVPAAASPPWRQVNMATSWAFSSHPPPAATGDCPSPTARA